MNIFVSKCPYVDTKQALAIPNGTEIVIKHTEPAVINDKDSLFVFFMFGKKKVKMALDIFNFIFVELNPGL